MAAAVTSSVKKSPVLGSFADPNALTTNAKKVSALVQSSPTAATVDSAAGAASTPKRRPSHLQLSPSAAAAPAPASPPPIGSAGDSATPTRSSAPVTPQLPLRSVASVNALASGALAAP